jgi:hypothetical protein
MSPAHVGSPQLLSHFVDAGLGTRFVVLTPWRTTYTNTPDSLVAKLYGQSAQSGDDPACCTQPTWDGTVELPLREGSCGLSENSRRVGLPLREFDGVVGGTVIAQRHKHVPPAIHDAHRF